MLIEFSVENYRSFKERKTLSLIASSGNELQKNLINISSENDKIPPLVRSTAIYGANASGKSNLIRAAFEARELILNSSKATEGDEIDVTPFMLCETTPKLPSIFDFMFLAGGVRYQYGFSVTKKQIIREWLYAYPHGRTQEWIERAFNSNTGNYDIKFGDLFKDSHPQKEQYRTATRTNELLLSKAIQLNSEHLKPLFRWFDEGFEALPPRTVYSPSATLEYMEKSEAEFERVRKLISGFDVGIVNFELSKKEIELQKLPKDLQKILKEELRSRGKKVRPNKGHFEVKTFHPLHEDLESGKKIKFEMEEESEGTKKLFSLVGYILMCLEEGKVLMVDEMSNSLHPIMAYRLIEMVNDSSINKGNGQLIFSTHDATQLDSKLLRRDQIWFTERRNDGATDLYPLSDLSPRKDEAFEKGYLKGKYGAIPCLGKIEF